MEADGDGRPRKEMVASLEIAQKKKDTHLKSSGFTLHEVAREANKVRFKFPEGTSVEVIVTSLDIAREKKDAYLKHLHRSEMAQLLAQARHRMQLHNLQQQQKQHTFGTRLIYNSAHDAAV